MKTFVITPRTGKGILDDPHYPLLNELLKGYKDWSWTDATNQPTANMPTNPDLLGVQLDCDAATLAAVDADGRFKIIYRDTDKQARPTTAEVTALRTWLRDNGVTAIDATSLTSAARTREENGEMLRLWLRDRPKAAVTFRAAMLSQTETVPTVNVFGKQIPLSSQWTYDNVIKPVMKLFRG
jgi:hypothetical protein